MGNTRCLTTGQLENNFGMTCGLRMRKRLLRLLREPFVVALGRQGSRPTPTAAAPSQPLRPRGPAPLSPDQALQVRGLTHRLLDNGLAVR